MPPTIAIGFPVSPATKLELGAIRYPHAYVKKQREIDGTLEPGGHVGNYIWTTFATSLAD